MARSHYNIIFLDASKENLSPQELQDVSNQTDILKHIRGNFLDYIIEIELIIDLLIEHFIIHKQLKLNKVFKKNVLNNKGINLKQKIEILSEILKSKCLFKEPELKLLNHSLNSLRDDRNRWAHGYIYFRQENQGATLRFQSYLNYINSKGEEKEIILTDSYFDELTLKFKTAQRLLVQVLKKRGFLPKNLPIQNS